MLGAEDIDRLLQFAIPWISPACGKPILLIHALFVRQSGTGVSRGRYGQCAKDGSPRDRGSDLYCVEHSFVPLDTGDGSQKTALMPQNVSTQEIFVLSTRVSAGGSARAVHGNRRQRDTAIELKPR
jgi:hypothetical protein